MPKVRWLGFEIVKERWNAYMLQDGSILRTRIILKSVKDVSPKFKLLDGVDAALLVTIQANPALEGEPNPTEVSKDEVLRNIELKDMQYNSLRYDPNEYMLSNGETLLIRTNIVSISRSSLKNKHGYPIYFIQTSNPVSFKPVSRL